MIAPIPFNDVVIDLYGGEILFLIDYEPDTEFVPVYKLDLNLQQKKDLELISSDFKNLQDHSQIEVYTGTVRLKGKLVFVEDRSYMPKVARTLAIPLEDDARYAHLTNKVIELVSEKDYNIWDDFDQSTRRTEYEKRLFDITVPLFRAHMLQSIVDRTEFLKTLNGSDGISWNHSDVQTVIKETKEI